LARETAGLSDWDSPKSLRVGGRAVCTLTYGCHKLHFMAHISDLFYFNFSSNFIDFLLPGWPIN